MIETSETVRNLLNLSLNNCDFYQMAQQHLELRKQIRKVEDARHQTIQIFSSFFTGLQQNLMEQ